MNAIRAIWQHGQIVPEQRVDWPEGRRLLILEETPLLVEFMTEEEQRTDPAAIARWIDELRAIPPLTLSAEQEAELRAWRQKVKAVNLEAVRRQMEEGLS